MFDEEFGSFYKTVGGAEGDKCYYPTRLDPYGKGCFYDCSYRYAKQLLEFRGLWNPKEPGAADIMDIKETVKKIKSGDVIRLGGMTDCFQPMERHLRNTYKTIKMLNKRKIHYLIVTKSDMVIRKEYLKLLDSDLAHIQISIPSTDNKILKRTDNAKPFERRKEVVETLYSRGYDVSVRLAPFFYDTCDFDLINDINSDKCLVEFLRLNGKIKNTLKGIIDTKKYNLNEGGYQHLPLEEKLNVLGKLKFKEISVCDDVQNHYDYFEENINFNPNDCCNLTL